MSIYLSEEIIPVTGLLLPVKQCRNQSQSDAQISFCRISFVTLVDNAPVHRLGQTQFVSQRSAEQDTLKLIVLVTSSHDHCLSHQPDVSQDAFPPNFVRQNRFQRQATLLVYLNDVHEGGMTHFDRLGVSIKPQCGKALLFFPAFSDGTPDPR